MEHDFWLKRQTTQQRDPNNKIGKKENTTHKQAYKYADNEIGKIDVYPFFSNYDLIPDRSVTIFLAYKKTTKDRHHDSDQDRKLSKGTIGRFDDIRFDFVDLLQCRK